MVLLPIPGKEQLCYPILFLNACSPCAAVSSS
jgi:hypothetical protein